MLTLVPVSLAWLVSPERFVWFSSRFDFWLVFVGRELFRIRLVLSLSLTLFLLVFGITAGPPWSSSMLFSAVPNPSLVGGNGTTKQAN